VVEFALVLVIFVALLYGLLEMCRLMLIDAELENAAREGAAYAALHPGVAPQCLKAKAMDSKFILVDKNSPYLFVQKDFLPRLIDGTPQPGGIGPGYPVKVSVGYSWVSLVNIVPVMQTSRSVPISLARLEVDMGATATELIEVVDASALCP
jgi:hypothetical protein